MVLAKWAVVSRSAPPPAGLRPLARYTPTHPRLVPAGYTTPYVMRTFVRDRHLSEVQHLENRGMLQDELCIERARFPRWHKTLTVQTDGALNEREFEFVVPPLLLLFHDRLSAHKQRQRTLRALGYSASTRLRRGNDDGDGSNVGDGGTAAGTTTTTTAADGGDARGEDTRSANALCNVLTFPYCVPARLRVRACQVDPLKVTTTSKQQQQQQDGRSARNDADDNATP